MSNSTELFFRAQLHIPGGVNSPVRAFKGVGGEPIFFKKAAGAYLTAADGKRYIDYINTWGPAILGHSHPAVIDAVQTAISQGLSFGAPTELEIMMAESICQLMPNIEMVRMVNSGTEATMSAIRLARGYTHRDKIIKFRGCYHGHSDGLLVQAGSGVLTCGIPDSAGVPADFAKHTLVADYNNLDEVRELFSHFGDQIAGVIVEPIAANTNLLLPKDGFLSGLRQLCDQYKSLLIFDEVITGFRVALGGAQAYYGIKPDLTTLGKIIGGGLPVGAFGGRKEIMQCLAPVGPVYQAGTLSGNPVAMTAGLATLSEISKPGFYEKLEKTTHALVQGLLETAKNSGIPFTASYVCGLFGIFFGDKQSYTNYEQVKGCNLNQFKKFFHAMLENGVYLAPSMYEAGFVSAAHGSEEIEITLSAAKKSFRV